MASWIVAAGMVAGLLAQTEPGATPPDDEAIRRAVDELGDQRFSVREAASRFLWSQGEAAEPALKRALQSKDAEVAYRARRILNDFRFGIFPGLPPETLATIRQFRAGDHGQRAAALEQLLNQGQMPTLGRLVKLEPAPEVRQQFFSRIVQTIPAEPPPNRPDRLQLLLDLLAEEPEKDVRAQLATQLLTRPETVEALAGGGRLDVVLKLAQEHLDDRTRQALLLRLFQSRTVIEALLAGGGVDRLVALSEAQADPAERGKLLAALVASGSLRQHLGESKSVALAIELARRQEDPAARGEYLRSLLSSSVGFNMLHNPDSRKQIWELVKATADEKAASAPDWRVEVMLHFFSSSKAQDLLPEAEDARLLLRLVRESPAGQSRTRLVERLAGDLRIANVLIRHGELESLLALVGELDAGKRGVLRSQLVARGEVSQSLAEKGRIELLMTLAEEESDAQARAAYLGGLFMNSHAMGELIKGGHYDAFRRAIDVEEDPVRRAVLRGAFVSSGPVVEAIDENGQLKTLLDFARDESDPEARRQYLEQLFSHEKPISLLIERGHDDALLALARDEDAAQQAELRRRLFANNSMMNRLVETGRAAVLLEPAGGIADEQERFMYVSRIVSRPQALAALAEEGRFERLVELIGADKKDSSRAMVLRNAFSARQVVEHFAEQDALDDFFRLLDAQWTDARLPVLEKMVTWSTMSLVIEHDGLDEYLGAIRRQPAAEWRGRTLGRVMASSQVISHFKTEGRSGLPGEIAEDLDDEKTRQAFLEALFSSSSALGSWIESGAFETLRALTSGLSDGRARARLLVLLLTNPRAPDLVDGRDRLGLVLDLVSGEEDVQIRRGLLSSWVNSRTAVADLARDGRLDQVLQLCRSDPDASQRRRMLAELLRAREALERLAASRGLRASIQDVFDEPDKSMRTRLLSGWLPSVEVTDMLVDQGLFDILYEAVRDEDDPNRRLTNTVYLLTAPKATQKLAVEGRLDTLVRVLSEAPTDGAPPPYASKRTRYRGVSEQLLRIVFSRPDSLTILLDGGLLERLLELIHAQPEGAARNDTMRCFLFSPPAIAGLESQRWLDHYWSLLRNEPDPDGRRATIVTLLADRTAMEHLCQANAANELIALIDALPESERREISYSLVVQRRSPQALIENGQERLLVRLVRGLSEERFRRHYLVQILYGPSGIVARHLLRDEHADAKAMLEENAHDDLGRLQLTAFTLLSGRIDERIAAERERLARQAEAPPEDYRLLTYLLRSKGDLDGACEAADRTNDPGLRLAMLAEAGRWSEAAALQAAETCPLPIPTIYRAAEDDLGPRAEQLSLLAAYRRLAGQAGESDKTLGELCGLADSHPDDKKVGWYCVEALLLNDRIEDGLERLGALYPHRAFDLHVHRHEYGKAFALAGLDGSIPPDDDWPGSLSAGLGTAAEQTRARIELALNAAGTLRMLGKTAEAKRLCGLAEQYAAAQRSNDADRPFQSSAARCSEALSLHLVASGEEERAWKWTAQAHACYSTSQPPPLYQRLYGDRRDEARGWWQLFHKQYATEPRETIYPRVHRALNPPPDEVPETFAELVAQVPALIEGMRDYEREEVLTAVGEACLRRDRPELARRFLEPYCETSPTAAFLLGEALRKSEKWPEAAEAYRTAWNLDHDRTDALYLAGDALERAGRPEEGARQKHLADLVTLESRARVDLALSLLRHGLEDDAFRQFELVLGTSPPGHWQWHEAARRIGDRLETEDPARAADWLEQAILDDLRTQFYLLDDKSYLKNRAQIHRLRAADAIGRGDFEAAAQSIEMALAASPGDTELAETLVPLLDEAARTEQADGLVATIAERYEACVEEYPASAALHNNLAWLLARSGRRLNEAQAHAERAVKLAPKSAAYLDTLAEAHYRQGERDAAVRFAREALKLRPNDPAARERLERFQAAELP